MDQGADGHGADRRDDDARRAGSRWVGALLWVMAIAVMLAAAVHQRRTGPTHPFRGELAVAGDTTAFRLIRSEETTRDARVVVPVPEDAGAEGSLEFRRYPTDDPFTTVPMAREADSLVASLPAQPAAGKLEYRAEVRLAGDTVRIPGDYVDDPDTAAERQQTSAAPGTAAGTGRTPAGAGPAAGDGPETVIIRFRDPVPAGVLIPHVLFMFFAILVGVRAGLAAVVGRPGTRRYAWVAVGLMTVGGMILGPIVQKHAFDAFWTGWPLGHDLTDNKTLIMWLVWVVACAVLGRRTQPRHRERAARAVVVVATVVMLVVYLVPHSLRGSQLDYSRLDDGVNPEEAIGTGR
ncbi:MAG: hypothetical protein ACOCUW_02400 [Gemmatimonadota bacterium]